MKNERNTIICILTEKKRNEKWTSVITNLMMKSHQYEEEHKKEVKEKGKEQKETGNE